ncbi:MAG TPA: type II secretion system protein [Terriglobales bacterium]|jgi:general secretion pathway protein G
MARFKMRPGSRGFTLIELMIVISIMLILIAVSVPAYNRSIIHAREAVLKQDLFQLRSLISQYTLDKQKAPESLDDLVSAGYLKQIPKDPFTGAADWTTEQEDDTILDPSQTETGIDDVHSASSETSSDGSAYSSW